MTLRSVTSLHQDYGSVIVSAPASEPVTAAELRTHLRADATELPDAEANELIEEARQYIEDHYGIAFFTQSWRLSLDRWPNGSEPWWDGVRQGSITELSGGRPYSLKLPRFPLQSVTSVTVYDEADDDTAVNVANTFHIDVYQKPGRMTIKAGSTWPVALRSANAIQIIYVAGYANVDDIPASLKRAVKQLAAYLYSHRGDDCDIGDAFKQAGINKIVDNFRVAKV